MAIFEVCLDQERMNCALAALLKDVSRKSSLIAFWTPSETLTAATVGIAAVMSNPSDFYSKLGVGGC